jgi:methanethiol S-methyltransferase
MGERFLAVVMMILAVVVSVVSVAFLVVTPMGWFVQFGWPLVAVLAWDTGLSFLFFLQHSGMVRRRFRAWMHVPEHYQGAVYAIASGVVLAAVVLLWQPSGDDLLIVTGTPRLALHAIALLALLFFIWGIVALHGFDPCGVRPIWAYLRGRRQRQMPFVVRGPYRWVRHPLYSAILVLFWSDPDLSSDRLLFNVLWTAWICLGARLGGDDLRAEFGEQYRRYQEKVPALIPWRGPVKI